MKSSSGGLAAAVREIQAVVSFLVERVAAAAVMPDEIVRSSPVILILLLSARELPEQAMGPLAALGEILALIFPMTTG